jgi:hypothetical protein
MSSPVSSPTSPVAISGVVAPRGAWRLALLAGFHLAAVAIMAWSETDFVSRMAFAFAWGLLNFSWLAVLRRPTISAGLSLGMIAFLVLMSRFKHDIVQMTVNFIDLMIVDFDSLTFLFTMLPSLRWSVPVVALATVPLLMLIWQLDPFHVRRFRSYFRANPGLPITTTTTSRSSFDPALKPCRNSRPTASWSRTPSSRIG